MNIFLSVLLLIGFISAAYWSVRASVADYYFRFNNLESLRRAVKLAPGNASYHALLAEHEEGFGIDPDAELKKASALSPLDAGYWIRRAFRAEVGGDLAGAERDLLHAASVDRKFTPRSALMNFYFRRGRADRFWYWAARALEMGHGDLTPVFQAMWELSQDEPFIRRSIPETGLVMTQYLGFLTRNHPEVAGPVGVRAGVLADASDGANRDSLVEDCERLTERNPSAALSLWNEMARRKLIPFDVLNPRDGLIVSDPGFGLPRFQKGFDWRIPVAEGVNEPASGEPGEWGARLTGSEPEECVLLSQLVPVEPGLAYLIRFEYRVDAGVFGLAMEAGGESVDLPGAARGEPGTEWKQAQIRFRGERSGIARLVLRYKRPVGRVRAEGAVAVRGIGSELVR